MTAAIGDRLSAIGSATSTLARSANKGRLRPRQEPRSHFGLVYQCVPASGTAVLAAPYRTSPTGFVSNLR